MKKLLDQIMKTSFVAVDGSWYISKLLLSILLEGEQSMPLELITRHINGCDFILADSIHQDVRNKLGLFNIRGTTSSRITKPSSKYTENANAEFDLCKAISTAPDYKHEFVDHFVDAVTIERKCMTLSILRVIGSQYNNLNYLESIYHLLKVEGIVCEFHMNSLREFQKNLNWYRKMGFVRACILRDF